MGLSRLARQPRSVINPAAPGEGLVRRARPVVANRLHDFLNALVDLRLEEISQACTYNQPEKHYFFSFVPVPPSASSSLTMSIFTPGSLVTSSFGGIVTERIPFLYTAFTASRLNLSSGT